jgi:GDPmannose 4,6-dehydratase
MKVLIVGCRGQDGKWLSKILSSSGYQVIGVHNSSSDSTTNLPFSLRTINSNLVREDIIDLSNYHTAMDYLSEIQPAHVYHLAAVHESSENRKNFMQENAGKMKKCHVDITFNLLDWITKRSKSTKLAVALSSQMYSAGNKKTEIFEHSIALPQNIYGETKLQSFNLIKKYRNLNNIFALGLILFNHASIYSKPNFLFKVLAKQVSDFQLKKSLNITLRNVNHEIDICDAQEVCNAMRLSLESNIPRDYVISSGKLVSIKSIIKETAQVLNINVSEKELISTKNNLQKNILYGNAGKIFDELGWQAFISPGELLAEMVNYEQTKSI